MCKHTCTAGKVRSDLGKLSELETKGAGCRTTLHLQAESDLDLCFIESVSVVSWVVPSARAWAVETEQKQPGTSSLTEGLGRHGEVHTL